MLIPVEQLLMVATTAERIATSGVFLGTNDIAMEEQPQLRPEK